jgi:arsenite-transporting ATPase
MQHVAVRVRELRTVLTDATRSSYRIVVTPDRMVLKEAQRAETYLSLFEYPIDAVVVNRVLAQTPPGATAPFMETLLERQRIVLEEIGQAFPALPRFEAPLLAQEPIGLPALASFGGQLFGERDPTAVMYTGATLRFERTRGGYLLRIPMPNVEVAKLALTKRADDLNVDVGNFRRHVTLPAAMAAMEPGTAHMQDGELLIPFTASKNVRSQAQSGDAQPDGEGMATAADSTIRGGRKPWRK